MTAPLHSRDFVDFFRAVHDCDPFPWQIRLAERVVNPESNWPEYLGLPTASGKTACIDVAVFALAAQAASPANSRTAVRRIFFVVDRRVVVHQAFRHAQKLARELAHPGSEIVARVAAALQQIGADAARPLDAYELHGGIYRESAWVRSPLQPTVITTTVDQYGSRLLFRGYGVSQRTRSIHAALTANDALVLLDEAHTAAPFAQTMRLISGYRQSNASHPTQFPSLWFCQLTATPPPGVSELCERLQPSDFTHPAFGPRLTKPKPVHLVEIPKLALMPDKLALQARNFLESGSASVAVLVNRVATARTVRRLLLSELGDTCQVVLMTGRMRPLDREKAVNSVEPLQTNSGIQASRPIIVIATQCLEVGADLDFESLVTECASLDALRQRFGRLNRAALRPPGHGVILAAKDAIKTPDPIYGEALAATWRWLQAQSASNAKGREIDFCSSAMDNLWQATPDLERTSLVPPPAWSATLLPAHLDLLCQTHPAPSLDPDPGAFLHATDQTNRDVQVVFRADLGPDSSKWGAIVALCPPSAAEALSVTLWTARSWLNGTPATDDSGDIEDGAQPDDDGDRQSHQPRRVLRWEGAANHRTKLVGADDLRPGDLLVAPTDVPGADLLGDFPNTTPDDQADIAFQRSRDRAIARLTPSNLSVDDEDLDNDLNAALDHLLIGIPRDCQRATALLELKHPRRREIKPHPLGGLVVIGRRRLGQFANLGASDPIESWDTGADVDYPLTDHCKDVAAKAASTACSIGFEELSPVFKIAGEMHDAGKADPRFQAWLRGGNRSRAALTTPVAKATVAMPGMSRETARERAGYPAGCRHELYSARMAEQSGLTGDLLFHLISSHHGFCRPFAPIPEAGQETAFSLDGLNFTPLPGSATGHGMENAGSGVTERFWGLTRIYGWWGLAYLETILRLADWACPEPKPEANK